MGDGGGGEEPMSSISLCVYEWHYGAVAVSNLKVSFPTRAEAISTSKCDKGFCNIRKIQSCFHNYNNIIITRYNFSCAW